MYGFYTVDGARYSMNTTTHTISGGNLPKGTYVYSGAQVIIGAPAIIRFPNGSMLKTSPVKGYLNGAIKI